MYGKLFASMYDGTLYGQWQAIITLQQMVILADEDGVLDMTPPALAAKTSIPLEIIETGLQQLSEPDKYSRSAQHEGRRIILIDDARPWGWVIVNYKHYRQLANREDKKKADRERIAEKRKKNNDVARCRGVSRGVADVAHTNTDTDTEKDISPNGDCDSAEAKSPKREPVPYQAIVDRYHEQCKTLPRVTKLSPARKQLLAARWRNELSDLESWEVFFATVHDSDFLSGRSGRFKCGFDWLIKQSNCLKVMEGNYD